MNLDSFEDSISPQITLLRGLVYYQEDNVLSLEMGEPNRYSAFVKGSTIYQVSLTLDDQREVSEMACTCPYDRGDYCKHEVAVLYALRCQLDRGEDAMVEGPALVDLRSLLEGVSKEALLDFLVGYATRSPALVRDLVIAFPSSDEETNLTNQGINSGMLVNMALSVLRMGVITLGKMMMDRSFGSSPQPSRRRLRRTRR